MNDRQLWKYRAEWGKAWKSLRAAGLHAGERSDVVRMRWHLQIGAVYLRGPEAGRPKSSTVLTNAEFDRFLMRCVAAQEPARLERMLALDEQPLVRLRFATGPLFDAMGFDKDAGRRDAYLRGIWARLQRPAVAAGERVLAIEEMRSDEDLQRVLVALTHTAAHKLGRAHGHPHSEHVGGRRARSEFTHRVGSRRAAEEGEEEGFGASGVNRAFAGEEEHWENPDPAYVEPEDGNPF